MGSLAHRVAARYLERRLVRRVAEQYATFSFHPAARRELEAALIYYESEVDGRTADAFSVAVTDQVSRIRQAPERWPLVPGVNPGIRKVRVDTTHNKPRWPYSIVYRSGKSREGEPRVRVLALAHHKRQPLYWANRR